MNSGTVMSLGNERGEYQRFAREATASIWFQRFSAGCKRRMGQDWRPNQAISTDILIEVLRVCEKRYQTASTYDEAGDWIVAGTYFATCYVCSLRGPEGLLVDLSALEEMINETNTSHITVPLLGKVKGETHARHHKLYCVAITSSGLNIKSWYTRLLVVHRSYGRTRGPAICDECPNESNTTLCTDLPVTSILVASMQIDLAFIVNQLLSQKIQAILSRYFTMKVNNSTVIKLHIFHQ